MNTTKKIGLFQAKKVNEIFPISPNDLKTSWIVVMPWLHDEIDCIQINNKYVFSVGAHATHHNLLLSAKYEIDYLSILEIESFISYLFDSPCLVSRPENKKDRDKYLKGMKGYMRLVGNPMGKHFTMDDYLEGTIECISQSSEEQYLRVLPFYSGDCAKDNRLACFLPKNKKLKRAFSVYRQAILSVEPIGRILNYWRVLEAVTSKPERIQLIRMLKEIRLTPVYCMNYLKSSNNKFNLMYKYKKFALKYLEQLLKIHSTHEGINDYYYHKRRNPSVHAIKDILEINDELSLATLFKDALFLKYLSRCAVESLWKKEVENI